MRTTRDRATLRAVAKEAGVSIATVSRVFSGADPVAPDKEQRVREVAARLSYEPSRLASSLRRKKTQNIGLVLPGFTNAFFFELIAQTVGVGRDSSYSVLVAGSDDPEGEALKLIGSQLVDGVILVASHSSEQKTRLADSPVPIVCFDRAPHDLASPVVHVDNELGAYEVTKHLVNDGTRQVAHIAGPLGIAAVHARRRGFLRALEESGLEAEQAVIVDGDFSEESGRSAMHSLLTGDTDIDAVFAGNDLMAIGAMRAASDLGVDVPADVRVAGFDGITPGRFTVPGLTTYEQPVGEMARTAVSLLLELIETGVLVREHEEIVLPGNLTIRESSDVSKPRSWAQRSTAPAAPPEPAPSPSRRTA